MNAKTLYSCFLSQDLNMETNEVSNQVSNNSLIDIYVDGNKLLLGSKRYSMYNKQESNSGFVKSCIMMQLMARVNDAKLSL